MQRFSMHILTKCLSGTAASIAASSLAASAAAQTPAHMECNALLKVRASQQVDVRVREAAGSHSVLEMQLNGEAVTLHLEPYSLRSTDFEIWEERPDGARLRVAPPPARTVRGTVSEWDGNVVVGSLVNGKLTARIRKIDGEIWFVQPLSAISVGAPNGAHIVFNEVDVLPDGGTCGLPDVPQASSVPARAPSVANDASASDGGIPSEVAERADVSGDGSGGRGLPSVTQISFAADYEYYVDNGSSLETMLDDIETMLIGVDDIYRSQTGISYVFNRLIYQVASGGPYTSTDPETLLDQFRDQWENVYGVLERDLAHLMTGKDLDGGTVGIAYLGEVCNRDELGTDGGYALSTNYTANLALRIALTAHELGHNWNADHCAEFAGEDCPETFPPDCGVMCACIGSCNGSLTQFGQSTIDQILVHRATRTCLEFAANLVYVNAAYGGSEEDGTLSRPYTTFREGLWAVQPGGTVVFFGGNYDAERTAQILNRAVRLECRPGTGVVLIGQ